MTHVMNVDNRARVLIVDDDLSLRLTLQAFLNKGGFETVLAVTGEEALECFAENPPHLVLLDVLLPGIDGYETCRRMRTMPGGAHLPILMLTGLDDYQAIDTAFNAGATDFTSKPVNGTKLIHRIRYMLRSSQAFRDLATSQQQLAKAQHLARLGHWELNPETLVLECFGELCSELFPDSGECMSLADFIAPIAEEEQETVRCAITGAVREQGSFTLNVPVVCRKGNKKVLYIQGEYCNGPDNGAELLRGIIQDVTTIKEAEEEIRRLALYDHLTGLANRFLFKDRVAQAVAHHRRNGTRMALLFLDLDRFKRINDTLGHHAGDLLLQEISNRIQSCIRESDSLGRSGGEAPESLVARLGGDEFTIMLSDIHKPEGAAVVAQRILDAFTAPVTLEGQTLTVSTSIGISVFPDDGADAEMLIKSADTAMYHAKSEGRNNFQFYRRDLNESSLAKLTLENDLHQALDLEQMQLYAQPQFKLSNRECIGAEILLRWSHHDKGMVPPTQFIPIAEDSGYIVPLGDWILEQSFAKLQEFGNLGNAPAQLAINISGKQLQRSDFAEKIAALLERYKVEPWRIELELTENILMTNDRDALSLLQRLKKLGVKLAIDDFGTGYSSLAYLGRFPIDRLKIDRCFIRDLTENSCHQAIVKAVCAMAGSLGVDVIAEGVETETAASMLMKLGCHTAQGYLFARPAPLDDLMQATAEPGKIATA